MNKSHNVLRYVKQVMGRFLKFSEKKPIEGVAQQAERVIVSRGGYLLDLSKYKNEEEAFRNAWQNDNKLTIEKLVSILTSR